MATTGWHAHRTVAHLLLARHGQFNVFQLLRLVLGVPDATEKRLRFCADLAAAFPAREYSRLRLLPPGGAGQSAHRIDLADPSAYRLDVVDANTIVEIQSANFCIASLLGPLPEPFTEWVRDLVKARYTAMADFFDLFNHRIHLLRYQLKAAQTLALSNTPPEATPLASHLAATMGLANPVLAEQIPLPARAWLGLAGLLANRRKSAACVERVLTLALATEVKLTECVGAWHEIDADDRIALGRRNRRLGISSVIGQRVWDQQARVRIQIGPLDYARMQQLLPPNQLAAQAAQGSLYASLVGLLRLLLDQQVDCEVCLQLDEASVLPSRLGRAGSHAAQPVRLGQTAWLPARRQGSPVLHHQPRLPRQISFLIPAN